MRLSGRRISTAKISVKRFWQIAIFSTVGGLCAGSPAEAALYYWQGGYDPSYYEPVPRYQAPPRPKVKRGVKPEASIKEKAAKPQGPLIIAISIHNQKVRVFDANGLFAESPVSTGMAGHPTPMGVFSIIQKHKFHHSNIYSDAPMPYMQRITWSGVALHAGVLPGYPASHGCIRMPMSFAVKMWNWTRMGARVIVAPNEITPVSFSHPMLVTQKVVPSQPVAGEEPKTVAPLGVKSDKGADAAAQPGAREQLELRASVGHADAAAPLSEQTHTADATGAVPAASSTVTTSDARLAVETPSAKPVEEKVDTAPAVAGSLDVSSAEHKPVDVQPADATGAVKAPESVQKVAEPQAEEKAIEPVKPIADVPAVAPDGKKDAARLPGLEKPEAPKRSGQIAVFISRKDSKIYVRQNFAPLFEAAVQIAPSDRPLGTHVFTAEADKSDSNALRWTVMSLPVTTRSATRVGEDNRAMHRHRMSADAVEAKPVPDSPAEALDRITVPVEATARITEALTSGASIIVSDLGVNQGETGEGTDFIVPLR